MFSLSNQDSGALGEWLTEGGCVCVSVCTKGLYGVELPQSSIMLREEEFKMAPESPVSIATP